MKAIYWKELRIFFGSLTGYLVIGLFLILFGLLIWVIPGNSIFDIKFATLRPLFELAPFVFLFLIPAITMRMFSEEKGNGSLDLLMTRPVSTMDIILGKFLATCTLIFLALLPTCIYYFSLYELGAPKGNIDTGGVIGSYVGTLFLGGGFASIGLLASSITKNQIIAFLITVVGCVVLHWGFDVIADFSFLDGRYDLFIQKWGMAEHYRSIARGILDSADIFYFISVIAFFLLWTNYKLERAV